MGINIHAFVETKKDGQHWIAREVCLSRDYSLYKLFGWGDRSGTLGQPWPHAELSMVVDCLCSSEEAIASRHSGHHFTPEEYRNTLQSYTEEAVCPLWLEVADEMERLQASGLQVRFLCWFH